MVLPPTANLRFRSAGGVWVSGPRVVRASTLRHALLRFGNDPLSFDAMSRKGIFLPGRRLCAGSAEFPGPADRPFPPLIAAPCERTYILSAVHHPTPPPGSRDFSGFRCDFRRCALREDDTRFVGSFSTLRHRNRGDSTIAISLHLTLAGDQIAVGRDAIWHSLADRFEIERRDTAGVVQAIIRMPRPPRPVTAEARDKYKQVLREGLEMFRSMMPPATYESELAKVDETVFAENFATIGRSPRRCGRACDHESALLIDTSRLGVFIRGQVIASGAA